MTLPKQFSLTNKAILLDLNHVKSVGDEITQGGIVLGTVQVSESPTYGTVVAYDPELEGKIAVGDVIPAFCACSTIRVKTRKPSCRSSNST